MLKRKQNRKGILLAITLMFFCVFFSCLMMFLFLRSREQERVVPGDAKVEMERTQSEIAASEALSEDPSKKLDRPLNDSPVMPQKRKGKYVANVFVTGVQDTEGALSVSGFVSNIVEANGGCKVIFVQGDKEIVKDTTTHVNPTSTTCVTASIPKHELKQGKVTIFLEYGSPASYGKSRAKEVEI